MVLPEGGPGRSGGPQLPGSPHQGLRGDNHSLLLVSDGVAVLRGREPQLLHLEDLRPEAAPQPCSALPQPQAQEVCHGNQPPRCRQDGALTHGRGGHAATAHGQDLTLVLQPGVAHGTVGTGGVHPVLGSCHPGVPRLGGL